MNVRTIIVNWWQSFRPYLLLTIAFNVLAIAFLLASVAIAARTYSTAAPGTCVCGPPQRPSAGCPVGWLCCLQHG